MGSCTKNNKCNIIVVERFILLQKFVLLLTKRFATTAVASLDLVHGSEHGPAMVPAAQVDEA
jgi:hypothetical protein